MGCHCGRPEVTNSYTTVKVEPVKQKEEEPAVIKEVVDEYIQDLIFQAEEHQNIEKIMN